MVEKKSTKKKYIVFGIRAVIEAINSDKEIDRVLIKIGLKGDLIQELKELLAKHKIPARHVPVEMINRVSRKNHQGVLAFVSPIVYQNIEEIVPRLFEAGENPLMLVLDQVTDVRNFGAIARSAEVAGVHAIVIPEKGAARVNADAIKASAGALHLVPVCRVRSLESCILFMKDSGLTVVAATGKGAKLYHEADMSIPLAIVVGSEDRGVSPGLIRKADELIRIPQIGDIDSLNVSVAASVIMFDAIRQRRQ